MFIENKRQKTALLITLLNFIVFIIGLFKGVDLTALGAGLALINAPIMTYIGGETVRPTGQKSKNHVGIDDAEEAPTETK